MKGHLTRALIASSFTARFGLGFSQQTNAADYKPVTKTCGAATAILQIARKPPFSSRWQTVKPCHWKNPRTWKSNTRPWG
jgi:hypothetical protein